MIFSRKLIQFVGYLTDHSTEPVMISKDDTSDLLEEEVQQGVAAISVMHIDSDSYTKGANNIKTLCEAISHHDKAILERKKVELQIEEAKKRRAVDWGEMTPTLVRIAAYAGITMVILCLERQTPISMRWMKATEALLAPRG